MAIAGTEIPRAHKQIEPCGHPRPCGCKVGGPCCEDCGFDPYFCVEDIKGNRSHILLAERDAAIRQVVKGGVAVLVVAEKLGLTERTVYRVLEAR